MPVRLADFTWNHVVYPRHEVTPEAAEARTPKTAGASMEHRHFNLIADTLRTAPVDDETRERLAKHFAGALSGTNPRFSHERFVGAATGKHLTQRDKVR